MDSTNRLTAIYDACVLYPAPLRDLLMQLALAELFQARWTTKSVDEFLEILLRQGLTRSCSLLCQNL